MRAHMAIAILLGLRATSSAEPEPEPEAAVGAIGVAPAVDAVRYEYTPSAGALGVVFAPGAGLNAGVFASAALIGGRDARDPEVTVGGHLATPAVTKSCRWLQARGAAVLGREGGATLSAETCLFRAGRVGVSAPGLTIHQDLAYDLRPSLSASRTMRSRRYTGGRLQVSGSVLEGLTTPAWGAALVRYQVAVDQVEQAGASQRVWSLAIDTVGYLPPRAIVFAGPLSAPTAVVHIPADELSILGVRMAEASNDRYDVMAGGLMFGRLEGFEVRDDLAIDAELSLLVGDIWRKDDAGMPLAEPANVLTPAGHVGARGTRSVVDWSVRYARDLRPTFDQALALEDRLDGALVLRRGLPGLTLAAYGAHTSVYQDGGGASAWTGGASLARTFALGAHLALLVTGEAGRSWYATVDAGDASDAGAGAGDDVPRPGFAARASAMLAATLGD